ncbi:GreA/GreB family elongation factor [Winogradskyella forsetii]|uniref:GreA/GreB family elongation factor n=1 Tax=Winogradskyella forsetii TaxID=2686077 RepID=UPI0015C0AF5F|nr:GreA/GreB family elongation factor [Winogradskyella forsetii]
MSRGFVKEDDQEETPIIPPRAALPSTTINYVTPNGIQQLKAEKEALEQERSSLKTTDEQQRRRDLAVIDGKMGLLLERMASARIINPKEQPKNEIRFGAHVKLKMNGILQQFQIVGVDEADVTQQKIAFVAPIAMAITGKKVGDTVDFKLGSEVRTIEILEINYN